MKPLLPTPRRLLTLDALFMRRRPVRVEPVLEQDTRMPDEPELLALQELASTQIGRIAAEVALEEGSRRQYPSRDESRVIERR
ncbi:hypothetical protein J2X20_002943 [Pelomonas saccharophila]|uniref:Uncharacterized protein n=1 Tax=Roseateles saccharophilus TaxID=304 RepID=A0ABU1YN50_ROSSA|nr:hypothetical protein [Roseateles saccharophilus]MDR7270285.1 hypothetical protein [Roseateles saccharophilus]